jgi:hypothetical protein
LKKMAIPHRSKVSPVALWIAIRGQRNTQGCVEVTQRILAAQGLLSSNIGNDWSTNTLKSKIESHRGPVFRISIFRY